MQLMQNVVAIICVYCCTLSIMINNFYTELILRNLIAELKTVTDWHSLGIHLGVPGHQLKKIEQDFQSMERRKAEVLQYWLGNCPAENRSWQTIVAALKAMDCENLAKKLKKKYANNQSLVTGKFIFHVLL